MCKCTIIFKVIAADIIFLFRNNIKVNCNERISSLRGLTDKKMMLRARGREHWS